jgi:hypothetical protein
VFTASGISHGYYALVGYGPSGFAAFAVRVGGPAEPQPQKLEGDLAQESADHHPVARKPSRDDGRNAAEMRSRAPTSANPPMAAVVPGSLVTGFAFAGGGAEHESALPAPEESGGGGFAGKGNGINPRGGSPGSASGLAAFLGTAGFIAGSAGFVDENDRRQPVSPSR